MNAPEPEPPRLPAPTETLVTEDGGEHHLLWFDGLVPLPVGSRIEINNNAGGPKVPLDPERFPGGPS
jgi:hypothetical protein